ncbi:hypothetical protein HOU02_gp400 [Caulobacter phage CcrBL9]|uniref:Uncharacterized protein n=1 Tax=Caulobacter phage CcrBL9 TaxID=2283270 RepID=A0A385EE85_9CAUD|nr:hypothetical protein HOU02_gp400 [Caulobacter phage CcrBL9]AXQ69325.1 hypothetical protein CcrBL9_gp301 [Caulobacter phage CcrBL9]
MTGPQRLAIFLVFADILTDRQFPEGQRIKNFSLTDLNVAQDHMKFEDFQQVRRVLRAMEGDGLARNTDGFWTLTASGAVYRYLCRKAETSVDPSERIPYKKLIMLEEFDVYAAKNINHAPTELRERNLVEADFRNKTVWLSDVFYPLSLLS